MLKYSSGRVLYYKKTLLKSVIYDSHTALVRCRISYFKSFNSFKNSKNKFYKYDVQKLQMTETKQKYKDIITQNIANTNPCHWDEYKNIICDAATQTVGRRDKPERNDWFNHDCCLVMEKNKAHKKIIQGRFTRTAEKE